MRVREQDLQGGAGRPEVGGGSQGGPAVPGEARVLDQGALRPNQTTRLTFQEVAATEIIKISVLNLTSEAPLDRILAFPSVRREAI